MGGRGEEVTAMMVDVAIVDVDVDVDGVIKGE